MAEPKSPTLPPTGRLKVLAAQGGNDLLAFDLGEDAMHVAWSPDGKRLAAAARKGGIHLWDALPAYEFSEDGRRRAELVWAYYHSPRQSTPNAEQTRLRKVLRLAPDTLAFWEMRGHTQVALGNFDRAIEQFAKAIEPSLSRSFRAANCYGYALLGPGNSD